VNSDDNRARCGNVVPYPPCHIDHYGAITSNGSRGKASRNKAEDNCWRGQKENNVLLNGDIDGVKVLQKFSRGNP